MRCGDDRQESRAKRRRIRRRAGGTPVIAVDVQVLGDVLTARDR